MLKRTKKVRFIWEDLYSVEHCVQVIKRNYITINDLYQYLHFYQYMDKDYIVYKALLEKIKPSIKQSYKFWEELITSTYTYKSTCTDPKRVIKYGKLLYHTVELLQKYGYYSNLLYFLSYWEAPVEYTQNLIKELVPLESCVICMANPANQILLPCTHIVCCEECVLKMDKCPVCRANINNFRII